MVEPFLIRGLVAACRVVGPPRSGLHRSAFRHSAKSVGTPGRHMAQDSEQCRIAAQDCVRAAWKCIDDADAAAGQEQSPEQAGENLHGRDEVRPARDPAKGDAATRTIMWTRDDGSAPSPRCEAPR
jgi:hypothetical protein